MVFESIKISSSKEPKKLNPEDAFTPERIKVIVASSLGAIFEWYDFNLYANLASEMGANFFSPLPENSRFIMALITFAAGLALRPVGALLFGYLGDRIGRKYTFLATIVMMGSATFLVGCLPTYATIGVAAPILLITLRCCQGMAVGGEYGGAATYVAEHAPHGKRGLYTGFLQSTSSAGFLIAVIVVIICRSIIGHDTFSNWGWRIPFLMSIILLAISVFIRMKLNESPIFAELKREGRQSKSPLKETFSSGKNIVVMLVVLFGALAGQAVISYVGHLYAFYFMTQMLKINPLTANILLAVVLFIVMIENFILGWVSDRVGRKKIIMAGCFLAAILIYPLYMSFTHFGNPQLERAMRESPATVLAAPGDCSFALIPSEFKEHVKFKSSCDLLKNLLSQYSVSYSNVQAPNGTVARVIVGKYNVTSVDISQMNSTESEMYQKNISEQLKTVLQQAGYPLQADPNQINIPMLLLMWLILITLIAMTYGSMAAWLVELFPTKIRYTSLSLPYHIGNGWLGGFLPTIGFALILYTGNIYAGCYYPIVVSALTFIVGCLCLRETKNIDIKSQEEHDIIGEMPILVLINRCKKRYANK